MPKRRATDDLDGSSSPSPGPSSAPKRKKTKKTAEAVPEQQWPEYFHALYKIFKALNTVLAFCSARKHMAITFASVRKSVESILRQPLDLSKVAEIKALLPDLVRFAYIPANDLRINAAAANPTDGGPDIYETAASGSGLTLDDEEHVLILEFLEGAVNNKELKNRPIWSLSYAPTLTPDALKKLVEKRNDRFVEAVNELLAAIPEGDDPVRLLLNAARDHVPVDPMAPQPDTGDGHELLGPTRRSIEEILDDLKQQDWYADQIVAHRVYEPREATLAEVSLSSTIWAALKSSRKISSLFSHQTAAIKAVQAGKNVIVSTATASGKSVVYQVPVLSFLEESLETTALFVYPTKALAQDQKQAMEQLLVSCTGLENVKVAAYDGDTPSELRRGIRETASVIFANFSRIHTAILPHEDLWRRFLKNLRIVAVDELHYYSGLFGSHVAQVIRRLRRVCSAIGNHRVRFVSCSATISNPLGHMKNLFGIEDIEVVTEDGSPSGRKDFVIFNPPPKDAGDPTLGRHSAMTQATALMRFLMKRGMRVLMFTKIRKICEMAMKTLRTELTEEGRMDILEKVMAYRGGYSTADRRRIETEAFTGKLLGIVATNALELGIDIGALDAVIMLSVPLGGIASIRQQGGRAGRRCQDSLAVLVTDNSSVDQYFVQNPEAVFTMPVPDLLVDLHSDIIIEAHLQCAAFEMPINLDDAGYFGSSLKRICDARLVKDNEGWYHTHDKFMPYPAKHVSIRGIEEDRYAVVDVSNLSRGGVAKILEEIEYSRALFETYEGAVFIHQGLTFIVTEVSHDSKVARLVRSDVNYVTRPRDFTNVDAIQTYRIREVRSSPHRAFFGRVALLTIVFGFYKLRNGQILESVGMETPPFERETTGFWLDVPKSVLDIMNIKNIHAAEAIHAASHALINRFPMGQDLKTECKVAVKEYNPSENSRKRPARLIFFDASGAGGGPAASAFDHVSDLVHSAYETVESCQCKEGCLKCIYSPGCKEQNEVASKLGAQLILRGLLGLPIELDSIPEQDHAFPRTIVEASSVSAIDNVHVETDMS
ncbi:DEAD/H helicase [Auricularia subglabra TFB-10046 SS5]|nr:DEAD/H helicase [Auricularia subglabra TFB-10046 SS5]